MPEIWEVPDLLAATPLGLGWVLLSFAHDPGDVTITVGSGPTGVAVISVASYGDGSQRLVEVWRELTAGASYIVRADFGGTVRSLSMAVPGGLAAQATRPRRLKIVESLALALGSALHGAGGLPTTRLVRALDFTDTVAIVESTFGFPASGAVYVGRWRFRYSGIQDGAFVGLERIGWQGEAIMPGAEIVFDDRLWARKAE